MKRVLIIMMILLLSSSAYGQEEEISVTVNDKHISFDQQPYINAQNRTMVPLRFISEEMGCDVDWDNSSRKVSVRNDTTEIELVIGDNFALVNDKLTYFDTASVIKNDRTMVPVRFISETLGAQVNWQQEMKRVEIRTQNIKVEDTIKGTCYYVSNDGSDDNDGLTEATAYKTLAGATKVGLQPGDALLLRRGDTFREQLIVSDSGNESKWITYGAYGSGRRPRILGSEQAYDWTLIDDNVWRCNRQLDNPYGPNYDKGDIVFEGWDQSVHWGSYQEDQSINSLKDNYDWTYIDDHLYIYAEGNPDSLYQSVEAPQRMSCIRFHEIDYHSVFEKDKVEYIKIQDLEMAYAQTMGVDVGYNEVIAHGLHITGCHIGFIGYKGSAAAYGIDSWYSDVNIDNNVIHDCGRRGISINTYTRNTQNMTVSHVVIENNYFYNGYHTTGPDISTLNGLGHHFFDFTIRNNVFDERGIQQIEYSSNVIYAKENSGNTYEDFHIYNNVVLGATSRAILVKGVDNLDIWHNTIYGLHSEACPYALITLVDATDIDFRNNLICGNLPYDSFKAFCVLDEKGCEFAVRDYNLYYQEDEKQPFSGSDSKGGYPLMNSFRAWQTATGWDEHSPEPSDPLFITSGNEIRLSNDSPAVGAGIYIEEVTHDITGSKRASQGPTIGAYEFR